MGCRTHLVHQPRVELVTEQFAIRLLAQWCSTAKPRIQSVWPNYGIYRPTEKDVGIQGGCKGDLRHDWTDPR
jgi:hypothetical protein